MKVQPVFTSNTTGIKQDYKSNDDTSYSRRQYKILTLTGEFMTCSCLGYAMTNIVSTKRALKKIDTLPKDELVKTINKSFKKNIKWGLLSGVAGAVFTNFYFDWTEPFNRKLIAKSEAMNAQAQATKELKKAIKSNDSQLKEQALDKLNTAIESEVQQNNE